GRKGTWRSPGLSICGGMPGAAHSVRCRLATTSPPAITLSKTYARLTAAARPRPSTVASIWDSHAGDDRNRSAASVTASRIAAGHRRRGRAGGADEHRDEQSDPAAVHVVEAGEVQDHRARVLAGGTREGVHQDRLARAGDLAGDVHDRDALPGGPDVHAQRSP